MFGKLSCASINLGSVLLTDVQPGSKFIKPGGIHFSVSQRLLHGLTGRLRPILVWPKS